MAKSGKQTNPLVEESGMITHHKTVRILREKGWAVTVSPYYYDDITGAVRETDLVAERRFDSGYEYQSSVQINIQLFVECKYIKQEVVCWFDEMDKEKAILNLEKETNLKVAYRSSGDIVPQDFHQLGATRVAKLFSSNANREDVIFKAMNQCLHSQIHYRKNGKRPFTHKFSDHRDVLSHIVQYPVIVCDNFKNIKEVKFDKADSFSIEDIKDSFILETNYREDYFLVDIVDIKHLETFLTNLEPEAQSLVKSYGFKQRSH